MQDSNDNNQSIPVSLVIDPEALAKLAPVGADGESLDILRKQVEELQKGHNEAALELREHSGFINANFDLAVEEVLDRRLGSAMSDMARGVEEAVERGMDGLADEVMEQLDGYDLYSLVFEHFCPGDYELLSVYDIDEAIRESGGDAVKDIVAEALPQMMVDALPQFLGLLAEEQAAKEAQLVSLRSEVAGLKAKLDAKAGE